MSRIAGRFVPACLAMTIIWSAHPGDALAGRIFTLNATADAFVSAADPTHNFGAAGALAIAAVGKSKGEFQSLVRFDASGAKSDFDAAFGPGNWSVQGITLRLTAANPGNPIYNSPQTAGQFSARWIQNDVWAEGTGTPTALTTDGLTFDSLASLLGAGDRDLGLLSFNGLTSGTVDYTLTLAGDFVADVAAGNLVSLQLRAADENIAYVLNSHNYTTAAFRPTLSVTASPEPTMTALLLIGAAGLLCVAHRTRRRAR